MIDSKEKENIEKRFSNVGKSKTFQNIIEELSLKEKRVLDIGCSHGEHVAHFGKGSVGVTISEEEVKYGKERGLDIRLGNIEEDDCGIEGEKFDVIFANNIFEHLLAPHLFLIKIRKYLNERGTLILGVPCIPWFHGLLRMKKFRGSLAVAHINFFTKETLLWATRRGGWNVKEVRSFHVDSRFFDFLLRPIAPHFYVVATPTPDFSYHPKFLSDLRGYKEVDHTTDLNKGASFKDEK